MRRLFPLILLAVFATCTAQMCAKEETPVIQNDPRIQGYENNSYTLYAPELDAERTLMFSILYQDESTTVTAMAKGAEAKVRLEAFAGARRAVVTLKATQDFGETADLVVTATNAHGTTSETFAIERAKMTVPITSYDAVSSKGTTLILGLDCNIDANLEVRKSDTQMLSLGMTSDGQLCLVVSENGMKARTGVLSIVDADGVLPEIAVTVNQLGSGIPDVLNAETDKMAMRAIEEAVHCIEEYNATFNEDSPYRIINDWEKPLEEISFLGNVEHGRVWNLVFPNGHGQLPEELGWLDNMVMLENFNEKITGPLPKTLGGCKSLRVLEMSSSGICEKLEDSSLRDVISHLSQLSLSREFYGPFPEWFANLPSTSKILSAFWGTHLSGRIPDRVANMEAMKKEGFWCEFVYQDFIISAQNYYNYALWIGEQPSNVRFVNDEHGGHWEWTDTVFDEATQKWKSPRDICYGDTWRPESWLRPDKRNN